MVNVIRKKLFACVTFKRFVGPVSPVTLDIP